jgi:geranylgeranyl transferase type-1 subunit beta
MRFVYCASAISRLLGDWSGVDRESVLGYVRSCMVRDVSVSPGRSSRGLILLCGAMSVL